MDDSIREFHYGRCTRTVGPRGGVTVEQEIWRRNGRCGTWKVKWPERYELPIKHGLRKYAYLTDYNHFHFHAANECPLLQENVLPVGGGSKMSEPLFPGERS